MKQLKHTKQKKTLKLKPSSNTHLNKQTLKHTIKQSFKKQMNKYITIDLLLLPNQLFDINTIITDIENQTNKNVSSLNITILEHPTFFGFRKRIPNMNFNKLKLVYHHSTCLNYLDELQHITFNSKINSFTFIPYHKSKKYSKPLLHHLDTLYKNNRNNNNILVYFDPIDHELYNEISTFEKKYTKLENNKIENILRLDNLLFITSNKDLHDYHNIHNKNKSFYHSSFYSWQKQQLNILTNTKSYDTQNRNKMPKSQKIPPLPNSNYDLKSKYNTHINESIKYINTHFPNNYGKCCTEPKDLIFPISRSSSLEWIKHFCKNRLHNFGKYQDSIDSLGRNYLYHSCISPMLNIGLITPKDVIDIVSQYYNNHKAKVGISNYEGFIRQVIGWREYQRYCYIYAYDKMISSNYFGNSNKLNKLWYINNNSNSDKNDNSELIGIKPVDDAITMAWNDGYLHHILRLMVMANFMNLCGLHPDEVYRWFMEFSMDSYDWVMIQNVYSMGMWADGGLTMRKPYISSDGYIMKMSNYSKEKDIISEDGKMENAGWNTIWYALYYNFVNKNRDKLKNTYYAGMIKNYDKKTKEEKEEINRLSNDIISRITK